MQAVLMLAGKSTRTYPLTLTRPKPLLPIANRAIIHHSLEQLHGLFEEVILIVGYRQDMIRRSLGDEYQGMRLIYQEQKQQLGTGHAILQARPHIRGRFVAMNGDDLFAREDLAVLQKYRYAALAKRVTDPSIYGVCQVDEQNRLINMVEKPKTFISDLANIGCYVFEPDIFDALERVPLSERGEMEIIDAILAVAKQNEFFILPISGFWLPTGYAWDLLKHQEFLMADMQAGTIAGSVAKGFEIIGPVTIGKNTRVAAGCRIEGPVMIGEGCEIGADGCIAKFTAIGDGCRLGNAVRIENSILLPGVEIGDECRISNSIIGQGTRLEAKVHIEDSPASGGTVISMVKGQQVDSGRTRLGAIIADGVHIGAGTVIAAGCKIWPQARVSAHTKIAQDIMMDHEDWK